MPVIRQVVESGEGERVLCNEGKKNEAEYRHFVLGIVAVADTGLSPQKRKNEEQGGLLLSDRGWQGVLYLYVILVTDPLATVYGDA